MIVWITKYALTSGIYKIDAKPSDEFSRMVQEIGTNYPTYFHKPDWYESKTEACARAEKMRQEKIESLNKQIEKVKSLRFE